jgi:hypothetical protein
MLLEVRQQKNGTIVLRAPNGDVHTARLDSPDKEAGAELLQGIGRAILEFLDDPDMPEATVVNPEVVQGDGEERSAKKVGSGLEERVRAAADSIVPGGSRILDFLQGMSSDVEETG